MFLKIKNAILFINNYIFNILDRKSSWVCVSFNNGELYSLSIIMLRTGF